MAASFETRGCSSIVAAEAECFRNVANKIIGDYFPNELLCKLPFQLIAVGHVTYEFSILIEQPTEMENRKLKARTI